MSNGQFIALKKLKGAGIVGRAAAHNHREIQKELGADSHIDPARIHLNRILAGASTSEGVAAEALRLMDGAGIGKARKLRKDAVRAVEVVFSLPADSTIDSTSFFDECLAWTRQYFRAPVLSFVQHADEHKQHAHALILPLVDGRMVGGRLMGNRADLQALQADFQSRVAGSYGLTHKAAAKRHSAGVRQAAAVDALDAIKADLSLLNKPVVLAALLELIGASPEQLIKALGLRMPLPKPAKGATFAAVMTRKVKAIDFAPEQKHDLYHCVDFSFPAAPPVPPSSTSSMANTPRHAHAAACSTPNLSRSISGDKPATTFH